MNFEDKVKNKLIVSCQALSDEPLHSSFIMGRMALAAKTGGACGIRANSIEDIKEIRKTVDLPIIGIIKKDYDNSPIYITPTMDEIDKLVESKVDVIALDATDRKRPNHANLKEFYDDIRKKYPEIKLMADCSTVDEAKYADGLGFDLIGTTLVGYTPQSEGNKIEKNDFEILRTIIKECNHPVVAEGNIDSPQKAKRVLELGALTVVVGGAITRPQNITKKFVNEIAAI
ncbi:N-acetylmannosamine-6-phosphate 2-epimerase [uncultured Anaerococcus sp.]|uniref:N-acetylmannosamine-6-phosphate 2-epimerase n=1 Tax=uncultured Anaerococcus sp. TaxID=293428 RepID=UPI00280C39E2|nr:N-acetylmannosamine-6-phosphate 2-epimerase [uncultured Anaerococcus sp.]MDU5148755.1 N-acetylmannosamine-6-phosphate 2-epimerase [Anaerococcus prevotii]